MMAETTTITAPSEEPEPSSTTIQGDSSNTPEESRPPHPNRPPLRDVYALPAPIRTFPLPSFYPSNPLSLLHVAYTWLCQTLAPPPSEPSTIYKGFWSASTRSVHITNPRAIRALWEQGFYGKGNLSRSEPNWLKREQARLGLVGGDRTVSEEITLGRRNERKEAKWERARVELEAIERAKRLEAETGVNGTPVASSKVDEEAVAMSATLNGMVANGDNTSSPNGTNESTQVHGEVSSIANGPAVHKAMDKPHEQEMPTHQKSAPTSQDATNGALTNDANGAQDLQSESSDAALVSDGLEAGAQSSVPTTDKSSAVQDGTQSVQDRAPLKRRKSVRFSADVQSTIFVHSDPPGPILSAPSALKNGDVVPVNGVLSHRTRFPVDSSQAPPLILDREHLQLSPEEAFFLVFGLGALEVIDPDTDTAIPTPDLLNLFRSYSYFPPRIRPSDSPLQPDDPFLLHYAVYHHFRSLGWVVRHGIKFGVDWMLYLRGPVFNHAEFGVVIMPTYTDAWWREHPQGKGRVEKARKSWHWFHGTVRVMSHVLKTLVLVYVDVPNPEAFQRAMLGAWKREGEEAGFTAALRLYGIREVMVRRWSSNRNRA